MRASGRRRVASPRFVNSQQTCRCNERRAGKQLEEKMAVHKEAQKRAFECDQKVERRYEDADERDARLHAPHLDRTIRP